MEVDAAKSYDLNHMIDRATPFPADTLAARLLALPSRSRVTRQVVGPGESIFRQGHAANAVFLVEAGRVRLTRLLEDGTSVSLHLVEAGESFAEACLSADHYHCDAVAETNAVVLALPKADLLAALAVDPMAGLALVITLATRVRDLRVGLELRNIRSASSRVLAWLALRASGEPRVVHPGRSWTVVAEELGLTREAVYRALAMLERQGRIRREGKKVRLFLEPV